MDVILINQIEHKINVKIFKYKYIYI